jgi:hypothetical protein
VAATRGLGSLISDSGLVGRRVDGAPPLVLELDSVALHAALVGVRLVVHAAHRLEDGGARLLALGGGQHIFREIRTLAESDVILLDTGAPQFHGIDVGDAVLAANGYIHPRDNAWLAVVAFFDPSTPHGALGGVVLAVGTTNEFTVTVAVTPLVDGGLGSLVGNSTIAAWPLMVQLDTGAHQLGKIRVGEAIFAANRRKE